MIRRVLIIGALLLLSVGIARWYFVRSTKIIVPPTAGEPSKMQKP